MSTGEWIAEALEEALMPFGRMTGLYADGARDAYANAIRIARGEGYDPQEKP